MLRALTESVKPKLDIIRDQYPPATLHSHCVLPSLLNWRDLSARHNCIEILGIRALQFDGSEDSRCVCIRSEFSQGEINWSSTHLSLRAARPWIAGTEPSVPEYVLDDPSLEVPVQGNLSLSVDCA